MTQNTTRRFGRNIAAPVVAAGNQDIVKTAVKYIAPWLAAAAIGGALALAPIANAATDPLVPFGTNPTSTAPGYHVSNHDEANTTNGFLDVPF
jgi:hypothetical protein